ncbi:CLUMA_CG005256, isoform A [Clunio marinus]|uniref:CLUMA_CG005256, isoform A n=1 Tax=Clunio marinus TaxID=568069 RepID=A0A1J1HVL9_9DIPT|nr:CLUMA_CG005256, isoform A [Clunio marinus]
MLRNKNILTMDKAISLLEHVKRSMIEASKLITVNFMGGMARNPSNYGPIRDVVSVYRFTLAVKLNNIIVTKINIDYLTLDMCPHHLMKIDILQTLTHTQMKVN